MLQQCTGIWGEHLDSESSRFKGPEDNFSRSESILTDGDRRGKTDAKGQNRMKHRNPGLTDRIPVSVLVYILAGLFVVLALVLISGIGTDTGNDRTMMQIVREKKVAPCTLSTINDFFEDYYTAMSSGDTSVIESSYDDPSRAGYSVQISEIIDSYSDIEVYITTGLNDGEAAAFVVNNINFVNIDDPAPSVDSFYLSVSEDGTDIKIMTAMYESEDINEFLTLLAMRDPVRSVLQTTEDTLYGILESNEDLRNLYVVMNSYTTS